MAIPKSIEEYKDWARAKLNVDFDDPKIERIYTQNSNNIKSSLASSEFFVYFLSKSATWQEKYLAETKTDLFMGNSDPNLKIKPYKSVVEKTFRMNVLWNENFPDPPKKGWVDHHNMYSLINDLIRGTLVCRFIDGPKFVGKEIARYAKENYLYSRQYSQERDDGYYAYHVYISFPVTIFDIEWNAQNTMVEVEIQLIMQLQEVLRGLTHHFYVQQRSLSKKDTSKWKWDFSSSRFKVGYLSHTLHLLESIILESRQRVLGDSSDPNDSEEKADD